MTDQGMRQHAGGWAKVQETPEGVMVTWDNGLRLVLRRQHAAELARVLTEVVELRGWTE